MKKNKKILLTLLTITLIVFSFFIITSLINTKKETTDEKEKVLPILFSIVDKDTTDENIKIADIQKDSSQQIGILTTGIALKKDEYSFTLNQVNKLLLENISDYTFSLYNANGQVISDATFDKKTLKITLPKKYYENVSETGTPIQMQILTRVSKKDYRNVNIPVRIGGIFKKNKAITANGSDTITELSLKKYKSKKNISKNDLSIYINGSSRKLDSKYYNYDKKTGVLSLNIHPLFIRKIEVNYSSTITKVIKNIQSVFASEEFAEMEGYSKNLLNIDTSFDWTGKVIFTGDVPYVYFPNDPSTGYTTGCYNDLANGVEYSSKCQWPDDKKEKKAIYDAFTNVDDYMCFSANADTEKECGASGAAYRPFVLNLGTKHLSNGSANAANGKIIYKDSNKKEHVLQFSPYTFVALYCNEHNAGVSDAEGTIKIKITVSEFDKENGYIVLKIETVEKSNNQTGLAYLKFNFVSKGSAKIKIKKYWQGPTGTYKFTTASIKDMTKIQVGLYSDSSCTKKSKRVNLNSKGEAAFKSLELNKTYYVKEIQKLPASLEKNWTPDPHCYSVIVKETSGGYDAVEKNDEDVVTAYVKAVRIYNKRKRYCLRVKKKDSETNCNVEGIAFDIYSGIGNDKSSTKLNSSTHKTNSSGIITYDGLAYNDYTLTESSSNGTEAINHCSENSANHFYYNSSPTSIEAKSTDLTEMTASVDNNKITFYDKAESSGKISDKSVTYSCPSSGVKTYEKSDNRYYYCLAVKKVDSINKSPLAGAVFTSSNKTYSNQYNSAGVKGGATGADGLAYFFNGESKSDVTITETTAPNGYTLSKAFTVTPILMKEFKLSLIKTDGVIDGAKFVKLCQDSKVAASEATDDKYVINWYKETEDGTIASGAKFKARYTDDNNTTHYVIAESTKANHTDSSNVTKNCYVYKGLTTDKTKATEFVSDANGETCISGIIDNGKKKYSVEETESVEYHTFGKDKVKQISIGSSFASKDESVDSDTNKNKFVNYDTEFEFTKTVSSGDEEDIKIIINGNEKTLKDLTTEELKLLEFNVIDKDNKVLSFVLKDGVYEYSENSIDKTEGTATTALHLDDNRKIKIKHLPKGTYSIKEKGVCISSDDCNDCVGYYYPDYTNDSSHKFTITNCSGANATSCTTHVSSQQSLENKPTEIIFTKKDLYDNVNGIDKVEFENNEEVTAFDEIGFIVMQDSTNITNKLVKISDGKYRYVKDANSGYSEIHTKNGQFIITNLCRSASYTIIENSVPNHSIFSIVDKNGNKPSVSFKINETLTSSSQRVEISDEPTKIGIEKKDLSTNETIKEEDNLKKEESATFKIYRCKSNASCNDNFNLNNVVEVKFNSAKDIGNDSKVYTYALNQNSSSNVDELGLNNGKIIIRYLPAGFRYYVIEKNAPDGYYELTGDKKLVSFIQSSSNLDSKITPSNMPVSIEFRKDDMFKYYNETDQSKMNDNIKLFDSMKFKLYDKDGKILSLKCTTVNGKGYNSTTKMCESGEYRYLPVNEKENTITELNTINGTFRIIHLYNNQKYYIEEVKSDSEGNFILPTNQKYKNLPFDNKGHPVVTYTVPRTKPTTKDEINSITQIIENSSTRVVFEKRDSKTYELINDDLITEDNTRTTFRVYMCDKKVEKCTIDNGTLVNFVDKTYLSDDDVDVNNRKVKAYKYSKLNSSVNAVTDLHTDQGTLIIRYLPSNYKYVLYETVAPSGYYNPSKIIGQTEFVVKGTTIEEGKNYEDVTEIIQNEPTELIFNKEDLYKYYNSNDFASAGNISKIFDTMRFKLYNQKGEALSLKCTIVNGKGYNSSTKMCESGEYRYLPVNEKENTITELNTINGTFKVTHLYRNKKYYIEEIKSDDEGIFILPDYMEFKGLPFNNNGHPVVQYNLPENKPSSYESVTEVIENIPTRVKFEKRDSKYNFLISDETTTFNVYSCEKTDSKCTKENGKLVYFSERSVIKGDKEDNSIEVYKYSKTNEKVVSDLHPYNGILVLRYLPSKYNYVLVETVAPKNYTLPSGTNAEISFTVTSTTVKVDEVDVPNKPTSLIIRKYSDTGELLPGAEFKIYEGKTCNANLSAMNQPKTLLKLKTIRDGVYENRPTKDTDTILTCTDRDGEKCSEINTKLTYKDYSDSWANFDETLNTEKNKVEIKQGEALIQYLEYDHCYIIEEVKAPKGYSLPKNEEDRYTMVTIPKNTEYASDTYKTLINKPTPFTFYKYDEYNKLLDGAEFKLQKLDDNKKYHDITVTREETETGVYYKADESSDNKIITTVNGSATVYYLEEGQYRIVEVTPAPGKELGKNPNIATFFVDNSGNVYGNSIIVNKSKTEKIEVKSSASAELVVSIQTGQKVVRYGLIIATIVSVIISLMVMLRIYKKKSE